MKPPITHSPTRSAPPLRGILASAFCSSSFISLTLRPLATFAPWRCNLSLSSEGIVAFWLGRLESDCSETVFGPAVAAIAKMPVITQIPCVVDVGRLLPAYAGGEPLQLLRRPSFAAYLEKIRPRLEALEAEESEPKLIPVIFEIWENPEAFRGLTG